MIVICAFFMGSWLASTSSSYHVQRDEMGALADYVMAQQKHVTTKIPKNNDPFSNDQDEEAPSLFRTRSLHAPACSRLESDQVSITLVTQCNEDRLWMMEHHCQRWPGPISLAVYTRKPQRVIEERLQKMNCTKTNLQIHPFNMTIVDYPVNTLRNMAFSAVQTSHALYLDVDLWPAGDVPNALLRHKDYLAEDYRHALVLSAFQMRKSCKRRRYCPNDVPNMPWTHDDVKTGWEIKRFGPFYRDNEQSMALNNALINSQTTNELLPIPCFGSNKFEPFLVVRYCRDLPPFQESFTGYGKNKITWVMQLRRSGYIFSQAGGVSVMHFPHPKSPAFQEWIKGSDEGDARLVKPSNEETMLQTKRSLIDQHFVQFRAWLNSRYPTEWTRTPLCHDAVNDDEFLWVSQKQL